MSDKELAVDILANILVAIERIERRFANITAWMIFLWMMPA